MSDELRDAIRGSAENVSVPTHDVDDVVRGGRALKWRRRLYAAGVGALVAAVAWAGIPALTSSPQEEGPRIAGTPTPTATEEPTPTRSPDPCAPVRFEPTYLPDGWSYELQPGSGGQREIPLKDQVPEVFGHYFGPEDDPIPGYIDVMIQGSYYVLGDNGGQPIRVMGREGRIGSVEDGYSAEFPFRGCEYSVMGFGPTFEEFRSVIQGLRPKEAACTGGTVRSGGLGYEDGRQFGYIKRISTEELEFDPAEFLTGPEATEAALEAGAIEEGDVVPNDYFIVNDDKRTAAIPVASQVEIVPDAILSQPPESPDLAWLVCTFSENDPADESRRRSPYWITVENGEITKIEEQYVP